MGGPPTDGRAVLDGILSAELFDPEKDAKQYGTKGMKWGVTRALKGMPASERAGYLSTKDAKWNAKVEAKPKLAKISRVAARDAKKQTKKLREDYKDRGLNIKKDSFARTRYDTELKNILENSLDKASYKVHKYPPSRLSEVAIHRHPDGTITAVTRPRSNTKIVRQQGKIAKSDAKRVRADNRAARKEEKSARHADDLDFVEEDSDDPTDFDGLDFVLTVDDDGFVEDVSSPYEDKSLAHYGVRGMKWGVRRTDAELATASEVSVTQTKPGGKLKATGGKGADASDDAIAAKTAQQKAKVNSLDTLSNQEIQTAVKRMQLEQSYAQLTAQRNPGVIAKGQKFIKELVGVGNSANEVLKFADSPAGKQLKQQLGAKKKKPTS